MAKPDLRDNRKFLKLRRLLGEPTPHVIGYLECLWSRGYQTGNPMIGDELDAEAAAEYPGEPGKFAKSAIAAGFLDVDDRGRLLIHGLYEHAPKYAKQRMLRLGYATRDGIQNGHKKDGSTSEPEKDVTDSPVLTQKRQKRATKPRTKNQEPRTKTKNQNQEQAEQPSAEAAVAKPDRPRDELFDAIAEATATDPKTAGSLIGKVCKALRSAEPPYTPGDVRSFAARFGEFCPWGPRDGRDRPTPNELQTHVGKIRAKPPPDSAALTIVRPRDSPKSFRQADRDDANKMADYLRTLTTYELPQLTEGTDAD